MLRSTLQANALLVWCALNMGQMHYRSAFPDGGNMALVPTGVPLMRVLSTALLLAFAATAPAQDQSFYAGLDVGGKLDGRFDDFGKLDSDTPFGGHFGWQFHEILSLEAGLINVGETARSAATDAGFELDGTLYQLGVVGRIPVAERWELLGGVGAYRLDEDGTTSTLIGVRPFDNSDSGYFVEAGARFRLNDAWALRAGYRWYDFDPNSEGHATGGVELAW